MGMHPQPPSARNVAIYEAYQSGAFTRDLANEYGVRYQRIQQIVAAVAKKRDEPLRSKTLPRGPDSPQYIKIPDEILQQVRDLTITPADAASLCNCCIDTLSARLGGIRRFRSERAYSFYRQVYDEFMAGASLKQLAKRHGKTVNHIGQMLIGARRYFGLPRKTKLASDYKDQIVNLRRRGLSYRAIAAKLGASRKMVEKVLAFARTAR